MKRQKYLAAHGVLYVGDLGGEINTQVVYDKLPALAKPWKGWQCYGVCGSHGLGSVVQALVDLAIWA